MSAGSVSAGLARSARPLVVRHILAVLFGTFLCFILSSAFFPNKLSVEAQQRPNASFTSLSNMWSGIGSTRFCGESEGIKKFRTVNHAQWQNVPGNGTGTGRENFYLTLRIVGCLLGTQPGDGAANMPGAIIYFGRIAITATSNLFTDIILAVSLLALVMLGVKVALGRHNEFLSGIFVIFMKIGILLAAVAAIPMLYESLIETLNNWSGTIALKIPSSLCSAYTGASIGPNYIFLVPWAKLDCAAQSIIEVGQNSANSPIGVMMKNAFSGYLAKGAAAAFGGMIYALGVVMEISISIMILAHISIILLMMIAPLAWACIFFQKTRDYFTRWFGMLVGFTMQPILLCLFLMMFVTVFENVVCLKKYSVVAALNQAANELSHTNVKAYGESECTVPQIQKAFNRIGERSINRFIVELTTLASASTESELKSLPISGEVLDYLLTQFRSASQALIQKNNGYSWPSISTQSYDVRTAQAMARPFLAMFTAFIILFVLYHFLRQLPEFVNLLAAAAVDSGDINKVNRMGGDLGKTALSGVSSLNRGIEGGLRGSEGSMGQAQQGLADVFSKFGGKG